jgi:predicted phosphodiesterase/pyruvate-formate lyase-activating enzyme
LLGSLRHHGAVTRIAAFGGVYSNPRALEATLADARARGCDRLICLGDLGGFGAEPNAVWRPLLDADVECIAGNYDLAIASGADDCGCGYSDPRDNHYAQVMYDFTRTRTSSAFAEWMGALPGEWREDIEGVDVHAVHGSPLSVNDFFWESLPEAEARTRVAASGADVLVCAHTGIPWTREVDGTLVVNCGTIGRSANDGSPGGWYAVVHCRAGSVRVELVPISYDASAHADEIRSAGLPEAFAVTAETGWWTTCLEIVPPPERSNGKYHCYLDSVPMPSGANGWTPAHSGGSGLPVTSLFGTEAFPARLWIYSNFHCNLACTYCAVASSPAARPRSIGTERFIALCDEAVDADFEEIFVTGGEPFLERDICSMLVAAAERLPTTVLANAMLLQGRRWSCLYELVGIAGLTFQTSLDGARASTHDALRGAGSFERTLRGIERARGLGLRVRVSTTETPINSREMAELGRVLADIGIGPEDHAVRPLVARGFSSEGMTVHVADLVPELTVTADGLHWHPVGADIETSPDLFLDGVTDLAAGKRQVIERVLADRLADGGLAAPLACAIA